MADQRIPEALIAPVLPFPNPQNEAETEFNEMAEELYLSDEARRESRSCTNWAMHPDDPKRVYFAAVGWTSQGWRTYTTVMDLEGLAESAKTMANFVNFAVSVNQAVENIRGGMHPAKAAVMAMLRNGNCSDPECPVHGSPTGPDGMLRAEMIAELRGMLGL